MNLRSGLPAFLLGILLILLGIGTIAVFAWPDAPMEEPASPGRTPNPSKKISEFEEWLLYRSIRMSRFFRVAGPAGGLVCIVVGTMLLVQKRPGPS